MDDHLSETEKNNALREARERRPSRISPGQPLSRSELAAMVTEQLFPTREQRRRSPFNANYVAKLEGGLIHWPKHEYRAALREVLGAATDDELGFYDARARHPTTATVQSVNRRTVLSTTAGAIVGAGIAGAPTLSLLDNTSPDSLPRHIGREHIDEVLRAAVVFKHWDNTHGGAIAREIADDKLRRLAPLLLRPCPPGIQADLHIAFAELASVVAFMLFDAYEHDAARKRFTFALERAETGRNWQQRAIVLARMARQEIWCGNPDDGLTYAEMGLVRAER